MAMHNILISERRDPTKDEQKHMDRLRAAIEDHKGKELRDLTSDFKENATYTPPGLIPHTPIGEAQVDRPIINITGPSLVMVAPPEKKDGSKRLVYDQTLDKNSETAGVENDSQ